MRVGVLGVGAVGARAVRQLATSTDPPELRRRRPRPGQGASASPPPWRRPSWVWRRRARPPRRRRPGHAGAPCRRWPRPTSEPGRRWCRCPTTWPTWTACCSSARWLASWAARWWWAPPSRPGCPACWPATPPGASTRWTRSTSPPTAPAARPAPASTTGPSPAWPWSGRTACGSSGPAARAGSCAGSPSRSAPTTATGPSWPIRCCWCPPSPACARVSARLSATRRDRVTARLPMLRRPHPEGTLGRPAGRGPGHPRRRSGGGGARCHRPPGGGRRGRGRRRRHPRAGPAARRPACWAWPTPASTPRASSPSWPSAGVKAARYIGRRGASS